ncbi:DUF5778 family protein [Candidatus Halobonum tyrrellensis]|uniref:Uncharacterized protein n=1 Tax=Candidatus Halobonum tyrrellensis G22 TaxID=1324957 RepID=V4J009_9EURY|nr:DUF5778 family protein [Candidatus Halobonum tyrrellensis]ESP88762.1 hypothetical protein K933_07196 [Candidatus Halobonum tyrrellensis G22]
MDDTSQPDGTDSETSRTEVRAVDRDLYERTKAMLEPGEIDLAGAIVHTTLAGEEDLEMHELTVEINDVIADHAGEEAYIHAGNDDPDFASNQFQGLAVDDESFVWECQQLLREGTFDLVFYFEADLDRESLAAALSELSGVDRVTTVP